MLVAGVYQAVERREEGQQPRPEQAQRAWVSATVGAASVIGRERVTRRAKPEREDNSINHLAKM